ncbi:AAA family ATPase [Tumebacillus sp. ITR2]|uniref:AAA family ATPase n=1 Tax=Tumebacillus amylolyticus TaxID=2801339 RepID=A0ABS1JFX4_9BACL|nr:AAA family ATPase [Tumebacillus amylolyticus]MBL0389184.1 AAA family ATPase [Tumebacillus amylolyticus]
MFFLQMSGVPGSGKSTLARALAKKTGAVVLDHDVVKSALLESDGAEFDTRVAGKMSYDIEWALVESFLAQGLSVILDSPCLYTVMVEKGTALAYKHQATYKYVECILEDIHEIDTRLQTRPALTSQNRQVTSKETFLAAFGTSQKPTHTQPLLVDSSRPLDSYLDKVLAYVQES